MANEHPRLKLGKRASFVKTHLKQLPQEDETWEADFRALAKTSRPDRNALPGAGCRSAQGRSPGLHARGIHPDRQRPGRPSCRCHAPASDRISPPPPAHSLPGQPSLGRVVPAPERTRHRGHASRRTHRTGRSVSGLPSPDAQGESWPDHHAVAPSRPCWPAVPRHRRNGCRRAAGSRSGGEKKAVSWPVRSTTTAWSSRTTSATRWPRQWPLWRRG